MSEVTNHCRLSTTPDKSCVCAVDMCLAAGIGFEGEIFKRFENCPCTSQMKPVIRKSRMDELVTEVENAYLSNNNIGVSAIVRKVFAPAVDALERLEKAKKEGLAVIRSDNGFNQVCTADVVRLNLERGWKLIGYVVEDK